MAGEVKACDTAAIVASKQKQAARGPWRNYVPLSRSIPSTAVQMVSRSSQSCRSSAKHISLRVCCNGTPPFLRWAEPGCYGSLAGNVISRRNPLVVKMAAMTATVVPEFLHALRLKKREDPTSPALHLEVEGD